MFTIRYHSIQNFLILVHILHSLLFYRAIHRNIQSTYQIPSWTKKFKGSWSKLTSKILILEFHRGHTKPFPMASEELGKKSTTITRSTPSYKEWNTLELASAFKKKQKHEYVIDYDNALDLMERPVRTPILIHLTIEALILTSLPHYATWKIFG